MKRNYFYAVILSFCSITGLVSTGCKPTITVTPEAAILEVGAIQPLQASSSSSRDASFVWTSADTGIATVDQAGLVTGVNEGQTTVTARGASSGAEGWSIITVNRPVVTVMPSLVTLEAGKTDTLQATSTSLQDTSFVWTSDDPGIATVDATGLVTGVRDGQTTVGRKEPPAKRKVRPPSR